MVIAAAAAAASAMKPTDVKNTGTNHPSSSPLHAGSPARQSTATAMGSLMAQLNPAQKSSLCNLQAGNKCILRLYYGSNDIE